MTESPGEFCLLLFFNVQSSRTVKSEFLATGPGISVFTISPGASNVQLAVHPCYATAILNLSCKLEPPGRALHHPDPGPTPARPTKTHSYGRVQAAVRI